MKEKVPKPQIIYKNKNSDVELLSFSSRDSIPPETSTRDLVIIVTYGSFQLEINDHLKILYPGDHLVIQKGQDYTIKALTRASLFLLTLNT